MSTEIVKNMLYIMQLMCDLTLSMIEELEKEKEGKDPKCEHRNKLNLTVMGGAEKWICKDCGYEYVEEILEPIREVKEEKSKGVKE